jgi:plasmid stabilization system protein ParE
MRSLVWRARALADLEAIHAWLTTLENADPDRAVLRIRAAADSLARLGDIGRPSRVEGLRELSVRNAPYVIAYRMDPDEIDILAVYHTAQDR